MKRIYLVLLIVASLIVSSCAQPPPAPTPPAPAPLAPTPTPPPHVGPGDLPLHEGAAFVEMQSILGVQGSAYVVPAHSADVYKYYLEQMPLLGWTEVSRNMGIPYFEKENYGAAVKATENIGPKTRLVIGYAPKTDFEFIEKESVLLPVNYQTTFPRPTGVFIRSPRRGYFDPKTLSQTHATIVGFGKRAELTDEESWLRSIIKAAHKAGLKYTASLSAITLWDAERCYHYRPALRDATCIDIDGKEIGMAGEYGIPWHCTNNPVWRQFLLEITERSIRCGADGIFIDVWLGSYHVVEHPLQNNGCFCEYCMEGFREYLKEKYTTEELEGFGIENIDNFDYGDFIRQQYLTIYRDREHRREVPLFPDFKDYQMASVREVMHEFMGEIRAYAQQRGKEVFVTVNIPDLGPHWLPIQDELEYIDTEYTLPYPPQDPPQGRSIPDLKLARSLGKPALVDPRTAQVSLLARDDLATLWKIYTAEAYSARGFLFAPYTLAARTPEGWKFCSADLEELRPYYDFIYDNGPFYENLFSTSKIAVLYSYPSARHTCDCFTNPFHGISDLLLQSNFQYDVLFAGDDDWIEDSLSPGQLNEYEVVILPNTSH